jgi:SAM-dependent methyltransferase
MGGHKTTLGCDMVDSTYMRLKKCPWFIFWAERVWLRKLFYLLFFRLWKQLKWLPKDREFYATSRMENPQPLPHAALRWKVSKNCDIESFHQFGRISRQDIERALQTVNQDIHNFRSILEFGSGCCRTIRWMADLAETAHLYGTDIDKEAVRWSRRNIKFADFLANDPLPPLSYPDEHFDFIYSISVFTHLDEHYQDQWLGELKRVAQKGAILLTTVHGESTWPLGIEPHIRPHKLLYDEKGFVFKPSLQWKGVFPDFYHTAIHREDYVFEHWGRYIEVLEYIKQGMASHQDIVVLRKR